MMPARMSWSTLLFFRRRKAGEPKGDLSWLDLEEVRPATEDEAPIRVNRWFGRHPDFVLGDHGLTSGPFGETYTCRARAGIDLEVALHDAVLLLPKGIYDGQPTEIDLDLEDELAEIVDLRPDNARVREGSYFIDNRHGLMQVVDGAPLQINVRKNRTGEGIPEKHVRIISKLIPIRDAVRDVLKAQEQDRPWRNCQVRLRIAWSSFVRDFGPINHTTVSISEDEGTGEVRQIHRRPNLAPFLAGRLDNLVFAMVPGRDGHFLASAWRVRRPLADLKRDDFYSHHGSVENEPAFRARMIEQAEHRRELGSLGRQTTRLSCSTHALGAFSRRDRLCGRDRIPHDGRSWRLQALGRAQRQGPPDAAGGWGLVRRRCRIGNRRADLPGSVHKL